MMQVELVQWKRPLFPKCKYIYKSAEDLVKMKILCSVFLEGNPKKGGIYVHV